MHSEDYYQKKLYSSLVKDGGKVLREVGFKRKHIDLVHIKDMQIICIEVKLLNWKRAIHQASLNSLFSDSSLIAMPEEKIHLVNREVLEKLNIGLISIAEKKWEIKRRPQKNEFVIDRYYNMFKKICVVENEV